MGGTASIKSLEKTLELLLLFSAEEPALSLAQVSTRLQIPESTAHRILTTLRRKGFVGYEESKRKFNLTLIFFRLHAAAAAHLDVAKVAFPEMESLAKLSRETSFLYLLQKDHVVSAEVISSQGGIRYVPDKGKSLPLYAPSGGRAVLAFLGDDFLASYLKTTRLEAYTADTVTNPEELRRILAKVRLEGFAITRNQVYEGARGIAAPIFDHTGKPIGSLSVAGPDSRFTEEMARALSATVKAHAASVSRALGYEGP